MPHSRLIVLTLNLEVAVQNEDWPEVATLLKARGDILDSVGAIPPVVLSEIQAIEERIYAVLAHRIKQVKVDMRNLSAAIRIAGSRVPQPTQSSSLSIAS